MKKILSLMLCLLLGISAAQAETVVLPMDFSAGMKPAGAYPSDAEEYEDPSIHAVYFKDTLNNAEYKITYWAVKVRIANGSQLRTQSVNGFDKRKGLGKAETLARRVNAVVAVNGDYYWGEPGRYTLRQGQVFSEAMRAGQDLLLIDEDGDFHIILAEEKPEEMDKTVIDGKKVVNALCFGPALIRDGEIVVDLAKAQPRSAPNKGEQRIAICQTGPLEYMVITVAEWGMEVDTFARFLQSFGGIQQAYNLDGGNSSRLIFMGSRRNHLTDKEQRLIPDIVYFASAWDPEEGT